ncbi:MAG TPA: hypothetical protein VNA57_05180 [Acidimicrobiales bacterium]|nr:hypothetical protein [Acidimicrobiales bacterium]
MLKIAGAPRGRFRLFGGGRRSGPEVSCTVLSGDRGPLGLPRSLLGFIRLGIAEVLPSCAFWVPSFRLVVSGAAPGRLSRGTLGCAALLVRSGSRWRGACIALAAAATGLPACLLRCRSNGEALQAEARRIVIGIEHSGHEGLGHGRINNCRLQSGRHAPPGRVPHGPARCL